MSFSLSRFCLALSSLAIFSLSLVEPACAAQKPQQDIKPTLLAEVLIGEIALQRQLYGDAWYAFLDASKNASNKELAEKAYRIAFAMKDKKKTDEARKVIDTLDSQNEHVLLEKALLLGKSGDEKAAATYIDKALAKTDDYPVLFDRFSAESENFPDKKLRYRLLKKIATTLGENALAERNLAFAAKTAQMEKEAIAHILKGVSLAPDNAQLLLESADFDFKTAPENAKARLVAYLKRHPEDFRVRIAYAKTLSRTKDTAGALAQLKTVIDKAPKNPQARFLCGTVAQEIKDFDKAESYYKEYLSLIAAEKNSQFIPDAAYVQLGVIAILKKDWEGALSWFDKVEKGDKYIPARLKQVELLEKLGRIDEACKVLSSLKTEKKEQKAEFSFLCGQMLVAHGRKADSMKYYDEACKLAAENVEILFRTAIIAEELNDLKKAEKLLREVISLRPNDANGYNTLGYMWLERGIRTKEARPLIETALKLSGGKDAPILDSMGWLKFREGSLKEAESWLKKAHALSPEETEITLHLVEVLATEKKLEEAKELVNKVLSKDPKNSEALFWDQKLKGNNQ